MATEALATEKVAEGLVEEIKATEDIRNVAQEGPSESNDLEEKVVEEKLKEDSLGIVEASAVGSEERPENEKSDPVAEDVKEKDVKDSNSKILASDIVEKGEITEQEYDTLAVEPVVEVHEESKNNADDTDIPEPPKEENGKSAEDSEEPLLKLSESEAAEEPAISEAVSKEEKPTDEIPETSAVSEIDSKSELPIEPTVTEPMTEAITSLDDSGNAEISQVENSSTEEHEEKSESSTEETTVSDSCKVEETSDKLSEVVLSENANVAPAEAPPLDELNEDTEGTVTSQEVPDVSEKKDNNQSTSRVVDECVKEENASVISDSCSVTETTEEIVKPEDNVEEETQEKAALVEERTFSGTLETGNAAKVTQISSECSEGVERVDKEKGETSEDITETSESVDAATEVSLLEGEKASRGVEAAEEKNERMEDGDTILVETSNDLDVEGGKDTSGCADTATEVFQGGRELASGEVEIAEEKNERMEGENTTLFETSRDLAVEGGKATSENVDAATEVEGENGSGGVEVAEDKNETVKCENTILVDTTRDVDVEGSKATDSTAVDLENAGHEKEETEKFTEQNPVESAKNVEDTATEVPAKPTQRQSNNFFSKMKQSIVKVKKAIVGKSPNSKTMTAEGNGDIKVK